MGLSKILKGSSNKKDFRKISNLFFLSKFKSILSYKFFKYFFKDFKSYLRLYQTYDEIFLQFEDI